jgi:hypothetical protein
MWVEYYSALSNRKSKITSHFHCPAEAIMKTRSTIEYALKAGLVAMRAQGLEPPEYGKELAMRVQRGEITLDQMEEILLKRYADEDAARGIS